MTVVSYYMLGTEVPKLLGLNAVAVIGFFIAIRLKSEFYHTLFYAYLIQGISIELWRFGSVSLYFRGVSRGF